MAHPSDPTVPAQFSPIDFILMVFIWFVNFSVGWLRFQSLWDTCLRRFIDPCAMMFTRIFVEFATTYETGNTFVGVSSHCLWVFLYSSFLGGAISEINAWPIIMMKFGWSTIPAHSIHSFHVTLFPIFKWICSTFDSTTALVYGNVSMNHSGFWTVEHLISAMTQHWRSSIYQPQALQTGNIDGWWSNSGHRRWSGSSQHMEWIGSANHKIYWFGRPDIIC